MTSVRQALQGAQVGRELFLVLNITAYYVIWLGVPLLVADAISREKREGTLGLLFLTSLQAVDVVLGKGLILSWRALGLLLAGLPVLILPFLFGGVSWRHAVFMLGTHLLSLVTALAAGLTASSLSKRFVRAVLSGLLLSAVGSLVFNAVLELLCFQSLGEFWNSPSVLWRVLQFIDLAGGKGLGRALVVQSVVWSMLAAGLLWMVVRQVEAFWQEDELTSRRARDAIAAWTRLLVRTGVGLAAVVIGFSCWREPNHAVLATMSVLSAGLCLVFWVGTITAVIRFGLETQQRLQPQQEVAGRVTTGAASRELRGNRWTRWGVVVMGGILLALMAETVVLKVLPWPVAGVVIANHLSVICLAYGVGWLAWGWGRSWMNAVVRGAALGLVFFCVLDFVCAVALAHTSSQAEPNGWREFFEMGWHQIFLAGAMVESGAYLFAAEELWRMAPEWWLLDSLLILVGSAVISMVCAAVGMRWAEKGSRVERDDPAAALARDLNEPLFAKGFFRRRRDRVLEKNPMRWLLERSRTSRLHRAGWLAFVTLGETVMTSQTRTFDFAEFAMWQQGILLALAVGLAMSASMSFQEERRTGAMELILVTPMKVQQIILGRWQGLVGQFLPSLSLVGLVLLFSWGLGSGWRRWDPVGVLLGQAGLISFVSVPFVGMYASMRCRNVAAAWGVTLVMPVLNVLTLFMLVGLLSLIDWRGNAPVEEAVIQCLWMLGWFLVLPVNLWVARKAWRKLSAFLGEKEGRA